MVPSKNSLPSHRYEKMTSLKSNDDEANFHRSDINTTHGKSAKKTKKHRYLDGLFSFSKMGSKMGTFYMQNLDKK